MMNDTVNGLFIDARETVVVPKVIDQSVLDPNDTSNWPYKCWYKFLLNDWSILHYFTFE